MGTDASMTISERFLSLFADYRDAVAAEQRAETELVVLRGQLEEANVRLQALMEESITREREMTDRMMRVRYGDKIMLDPEQIGAAMKEAHDNPRKKQTEMTSPKEWVRNTTRDTMRQIEERARTMNVQ